MPDPVTPELGWLPHLCLAGYLFFLFGIGLWGFRKRQASEEDYYLAGRGQGWLVSSLTIMATFFSSAAMLGAPGMVYKEGVVFALFALNVPLSGTAIYLLGNRIRELGRTHGHITPADLICSHYGSPVALRCLVALIGFLYALPYVVIQIQAGGIISSRLFGGEHAFEIGACLLSLVTMLYIMIGGMRSVAWTDALQGTLLMSGMLLAGAAAVAALGGPSAFFAKVAELPRTSLSVPGTTGSYTPEKLFTLCIFGALGSMIQPAQWMRFYAAKSAKALRRSAVIFALGLTACFLFGVMLVGLGGQVLYPVAKPGAGGAFHYHMQEGTNTVAISEADLTKRLAKGSQVLPHPDVGAGPRDFDQIMLVVLKHHLPELLGPAGLLLATLVIIAIMAAAMSTADSNLHAMSAVLTRDIYSGILRPDASEKSRLWVGRSVIAAATLLALGMMFVSRSSQSFDPVGMIMEMSLLAIAFSSQLLPVTFDVLFLQRGSRRGAIAGIIAGLLVVLMFSPLLAIVTGSDSAAVGVFARLKQIADIGFCGVVVNVAVFASLTVLCKRSQN
ncbi:MAG: sodium:solute symporter family protein [Verrucomicrobiota bacterium]|jgi:SSS family solute:Na+ symporter|nr:sodium:solute symporter family protein [Verrucomicrobiota bacterium]MDP7048298.1 sodium:solute symporter family protein [Verrucomicrobiota bacterium]